MKDNKILRKEIDKKGGGSPSWEKFPGKEGGCWMN
jgi:hypothetical protein